MTLLQAIVLAVIQGATEFLPVSSSGHLVLAKKLMGVELAGAFWEVALHFGTLIAVVVVFRRELWDVITGFLAGLARVIRGATWRRTWSDLPDFRLGIYIILGTIPAGIVALLFRRHIEAAFSDAIQSAVLIFLTGQILWWSRPHSLIPSEGRVRVWDSLWIGCAQAIAILPGISRSGITISAALSRGISRDRAARFSFLLAVPTILGGAVIKAPELTTIPGGQTVPLIAGVAISAITGYVALKLLLRVVRRGRLHLFAYYCWTIGIVGTTVLWVWM